MKSNLTEAEREQVMGLFPKYPTREEQRRIQQSVRRYIFYETDGRNRRWYTCPDCGTYEARRHADEDMYITDRYSDSFRFTHKERFTCPSCGFSGILISVGKAKGMANLAWEQKIVLLREREGWLLAEAGYAMVRYSPEDLVPDAEWSCVARYAFRPGKRQKWALRVGWDAYVNPGRNDLKTVQEVGEPFSVKTWYGAVTDDGEYALIGTECIEDSEMRYCMLENIAFEQCRIYESDDWQAYVGRGAITWLAQYSGKSALEMLWKCGERRLCADIWKGVLHGGRLNFRAKTPWGVYRMGKAMYKQLEKQTPEIKIWAGCSGLDAEKLRTLWLSFGSQAQEFWDKYGGNRSAMRIARWIAAQPLCPAYTTVERRYAYWRDLLRMEALLGNNAGFERVLMPENLRRRHDECTELLQELREREAREKREQDAAAYQKRRKMLRRRFEFSDGVLEIRAPESAEEIEREGELLRHCVAGYADRHVRGVTCILFLRWADDRDTPYMTIEVNERTLTVVQIHGYHNDLWSMKPTDIHGGFIEAWLGWVKAGSKRDKKGAQRAEKSA